MAERYVLCRNMFLLIFRRLNSLVITSLVFSALPMDVAKCESIGDGFAAAFAGNDNCFAVRLVLYTFCTLRLLYLYSCPLHVTAQRHCRFPLTSNIKQNNSDPSQHSALSARIDAQAHAYYASARLWDDGVIRPGDTRDVLGLALALGPSHTRSQQQQGQGTSTTWDGASADGRGFGVFRM